MPDEYDEEIEGMADGPHRYHSLKIQDDDSESTKAAKARAIVASPSLKDVKQDEIHTLIASLGDISWKEAQEIGRRYTELTKKPSPDRYDLPGMENESHSCPEMLPKARAGPGTELESKIYQHLAKPRLVPGVEEPEPWSTKKPPRVIPDDEYGDEILRKPRWSSHKIDTELFRSQWNDAMNAQLKAYDDSPPIFPIVQDGALTLTSDFEEAIYTPLPTSLESDLMYNPGDEWDDWLIESRISSLDLPNPIVRKQFLSWFDQLPDGPGVVDIFHTTFFDGTAMPDGISDMFIPDIKHLPTPRNMREEFTRLHWHETSTGYSYNWSATNQKHIKAIEERKERMRRTAPLRAWLCLPIDSKVVPPNIYLRPAELYDSPRILKIMKWYTENTIFNGDVKAMDDDDYHKLLSFCREEKLPFVVAARRSENKYSSAEIDLAVGFAFVEYHRAGKGADSSIGELQVYVQPRSKKSHIGRALVEMVISCFDKDTFDQRNDDYHFDQTGTVEYNPDYGRPLTALLCPIADLQGPQKENLWAKEWLKKDFRFEEKCTFEGARVKFGRSLDLCYMSRDFNAPQASEVSNKVNDSPSQSKENDASAVAAPLIDLSD